MLWCGQTAATLAAVAIGIHHHHRRGRHHHHDVEFTHRTVCAGFQTLWLAWTVSSSSMTTSTSDDDVRRAFDTSAALLLGYFLYDAVALLTYTRRVGLLYAHHALSAGLCAAAHLLDDASVYRHLMRLAVCLELANPLLNLSWLLAHAGGGWRGTRAFRWFGALVLAVFVATRFVWFAWLLLREGGVLPVLLWWATVPYAVLSVGWFARLWCFYRRW